MADAWGSWAAAARCLALDAFAARTAELLTAAGVDNLLLKGPATAHRLYPDRLDLRTYNDVDLLVRADRFDAAQDILRCSGYGWMLAGVREGEFSWHEIAWRAPGSADLLLDLHRGFAGVHDHSVFFDDLWASREQLDLSGVAINIPSAAGTALILALHAASPGRGRKPLADIQRAHEVFPIEVWREAAELARRCTAEPACRAGLGLLPNGLELADEDRCRRAGDGGPVARRPAVRPGERQPRRGHRSTRNQGPHRLSAAASAAVPGVSPAQRYLGPRRAGPADARVCPPADSRRRRWAAGCWERFPGWVGATAGPAKNIRRRCVGLSTMAADGRIEGAVVTPSQSIWLPCNDNAYGAEPAMSRVNLLDYAAGSCPGECFFAGPSYGVF